MYLVSGMAEVAGYPSTECEFNLGYFIQSFRNSAFKRKVIATAILAQDMD